jgi:hypothetical protein
MQKCYATLLNRYAADSNIVVYSEDKTEILEYYQASGLAVIKTDIEADTLIQALKEAKELESQLKYIKIQKGDRVTYQYEKWTVEDVDYIGEVATIRICGHTRVVSVTCISKGVA